MKYMIVGAGGVGGVLAAKLAEHDKAVSIVARGNHLKHLQEHGLTLKSDSSTKTYPITAYDSSQLTNMPEGEKPDVIFVCVKGYSLDEVIPTIKHYAKPSTFVIALLNIFGTGQYLRDQFGDKPLALDGLIYVMAEIESPGVIRQRGDICRVIFGISDHPERQDEIARIVSDLKEAQIHCEGTRTPEVDAYKKFSFISPLATLSIYYDVDVAPLQVPGEQREAFIALMNECIAVGEALGIMLPTNLVQQNLDILDDMPPTSSASLLRDVRAQRSSEINGLVFNVIRQARKHGVEVPFYQRVGERFGFTGEDQ